MNADVKMPDISTTKTSNEVTRSKSGSVEVSTHTSQSCTRLKIIREEDSGN
jgi:hypothetical protein